MVQETEGQDMRETIQDKINAWFVETRHPETGVYPDFPAVDDGGCAALIPEIGVAALGGTGAVLRPLRRHDTYTHLLAPEPHTCLTHRVPSLTCAVSAGPRRF